jgi:peptide/nickel transport system permease protein
MFRFLIRKILSSLVTLFLLTMIVFFLVQVLMPGDYVSMFIGMPLEDKERLRQELGLDLPVGIQYLRWLGGLLQGGLGRSFTGVPVMSAVQANLPSTLLVFFTGGAIAFLFGNWLGKSSGWSKSGLVSNGTAIGVIALYAFFPPALAFLLRHFLGDQLEWFPVKATLFWHQYRQDFPGISPTLMMNRMVITLVAAILGVVLLKELLYRWRRIRLLVPLSILLVSGSWIGSWVALGIDPPALRLLHYAALPIFAFSLLTLGEIAIITRTSLAETMHDEYVTTARAKGLTEAAVRDRHAARNALLPVISKVIVSLPYLIAGLAIIEYSLNWQGLGSAVFYYTLAQDVPMVLGHLLFIGIFAMGARLLLEILYLYLDPRLRSGVQDSRWQP